MSSQLMGKSLNNYKIVTVFMNSILTEIDFKFNRFLHFMSCFSLENYLLVNNF